MRPQLNYPAPHVNSSTIREVVASGICVGCGACSVATHGRIKVARNEYGIFQAELQAASSDDLATSSQVCPFADEAVNEDALAAGLFPDLGSHDARVGRFLAIYAGRVGDSEDTELSSSGGLTSWLTIQLLERGLIDGVLHVGAADPGGEGQLFDYVVSTKADELRTRRKSQYYSLSFADVIERIRGDGKRYALVGVPCFVKAVRLLTRRDAQLRDQLPFCVGLVCGHLKSARFAELMAWQLGVEPQRLAKVDFRIKEPGKAASDYRFGAWARGVTGPVSRPTHGLVGGDWGHAMFQVKACDYCDDIFAETADIAFGDAWLPQYAHDWRGTNVVVVRSRLLDEILHAGVARGEVALEKLAVELAAASQGGNYRHRWDGLSVRLADDRLAGRWVPQKRIAPGSRAVSEGRTRIVRLRRQLSAASHAIFLEARERGSLRYFLRHIRPLMISLHLEYRRIGSTPLKNLLRRLKYGLLFLSRFT